MSNDFNMYRDVSIYLETLHDALDAPFHLPSCAL
jgi:hypothetical protein